MAAPCTALVYGSSHAEIVCSNPTGGMDVCLLWVLSYCVLCDGLITRPGESYRLWFVFVCDLETSRMRRRWPEWGLSATSGGSGAGECDTQFASWKKKWHWLTFFLVFLSPYKEMRACYFKVYRPVSFHILSKLITSTIHQFVAIQWVTGSITFRRLIWAIVDIPHR